MNLHETKIGNKTGRQVTLLKEVSVEGTAISIPQKNAELMMSSFTSNLFPTSVSEMDEPDVLLIIISPYHERITRVAIEKTVNL